MIRKFQFGGPGYFIGPNPLITPESIDSGTKQIAGGFNWLMGNLGKAFNTVLTAGASTDFGQTSPFTFSSGEERRNVARARERTRLKANKAIEENSVYISPTSYVAAITQGSLNPRVGAEALSKDPRLQALGIIGDLLTFKFGPKAVKNTPATVDKVLAATGNKGAKSRVVAREMDKTFEGPIDLKELSNHYIEPYVTNPKGSGRLVHYDNGDRASVFRNSGSYIQDGYLYPGLTTKNLGNFTWWNLDNPYLNVQKSKGRFSPSRYIVVDETDLFVHPLKAGKTVGQSDGAGRGFILPGEVVSESPVNLSNAFILEKDPFGWWNNVKVVGNPVQQTTHPWQLFNSRYNRFQLSNGKIRLSLSSHTESKPRQFVLEPVGDNKYYFHMRTWDDVDKHIPANLSTKEKNGLFEALFNEIPEGAEILLPESSMEVPATRGTIAGLERFAKDSRFTPGTKGTLYYLDRDGKTVRTYEGTSFIKSPLNSYELGPVIRGTNYANYVNTIRDKYVNLGAKVGPVNQNFRLSLLSNQMGFVPMFEMWPGKGLRAHAKEITRRLEQQGMDVDKQTANIPGVGEGTVREVIDKNVDLPSYIGFFQKPGVSGSYDKRTGITLVDPTEHDKTVTTMQHERNMHGTLGILTDKMWEPYLNFLNNIFKDRDIKITEINNKKHYSVTDPDNAMQEFPITSSALRKEELRATLGLYRKDLYDLVAYPKAKASGLDIKPDDLEGLRPFFELAVDELTIPLVKLDLHSINAYGRTYAKLGPKWNPNFLEELKQLLKYSPGVLPFMYNEKK